MWISIKEWFVNNVWKDAVWSKVIAAAIIAIVGSPLWALYQSNSQQVKFWDSFYEFWTLKLPLWLVLLIVIFIILLPIFGKRTVQNVLKKATVDFEQDNLRNTRVIYDGENPHVHDFELDLERNWDPVKEKRVGDRAEGEFSIQNKILTIKRTNADGQYQVRLVKYRIENLESDVIPKDLSKEGNRRFRVTGFIKNSGNGSQKVFFILRNENERDWLDNKTIIVSSENWQPINVLLTGSYSKDLILRIDSMSVINPPNSIYIKDLYIKEYI